MNEEGDSEVLRLLISLDQKMRRLREEMHDLKDRMTAAEITVGDFSAAMTNHHASISSRLDQVETRLGHVESRLEVERL